MDSPQQLLVIVYVSSATATPIGSDLAGLVRRARAYNESHAITGVLLHHDGCFMQALEGPPEEVSALFERIQRDRRHKGLIELYRDLADRREFPFWPLVCAPDARALGLMLGKAGHRADRKLVKIDWMDGIATGFLRTFTGPRNYFAGPPP